MPEPSSTPPQSSAPSLPPSTPSQPSTSPPTPPTQPLQTPTQKATIYDGITTLPLTSLSSIHKKPCVRDSLLFGMTAGFFMGGSRMILSGTAWRSMSWAIGSFCVGSAGSYEFCTRRRALEKKAIERASEIMERKRLEKLEEVAKIRAERAENVRRKQEEERKEKGRWGWGGSGSGKAT